MYKNNRVLCIIPARGGSKGVPSKNTIDLCGKPLIAYTIEHAKKSSYIDKVIVSTEDKQIAKIASDYGAELPFERPPELATDDCGTIDVLLHAIDWMENNDDFQFNIVVLLHVTTPLRSVDDVDSCIKTMVDSGCDNLFSVTESHRNPYFNMVERDGNAVRLVKKGSFTTRQSAPEVFDMNSSIYVWWKDKLKVGKSSFLKNTSIYGMPRERSVDIDNELDLKLARILLSENNSSSE